LLWIVPFFVSSSIDVDELPVAREESPDEIVAMISKRDIVDYYYGRSMS